MSLGQCTCDKKYVLYASDLLIYFMMFIHLYGCVRLQPDLLLLCSQKAFFYTCQDLIALEVVEKVGFSFYSRVRFIQVAHRKAVPREWGAEKLCPENGCTQKCCAQSCEANEVLFFFKIKSVPKRVFLDKFSSYLFTGCIFDIFCSTSQGW